MTEEYMAPLAAFYDSQLEFMIKLLNIAELNGIQNPKDIQLCSSALALQPPIATIANEVLRLRRADKMSKAQQHGSQHEYPLQILNALLYIEITPEMESLLNRT